MYYTELATIQRYGIDVKIFVMNNKSQDMVRCWEEVGLFYQERQTATQSINQPNYNILANAHDIENSFIHVNHSQNMYQQLLVLNYLKFRQTSLV